MDRFGRKLCCVSICFVELLLIYQGENGCNLQGENGYSILQPSPEIQIEYDIWHRQLIRSFMRESDIWSFVSSTAAKCSSTNRTSVPGEWKPHECLMFKVSILFSSSS